ncbi:MAG: hypothetical protein HQL70_04130 [Magnetococcales bacterium]|nr:hypothetical protein [Magnetococcales bacterium]
MAVRAIIFCLLMLVFSACQSKPPEAAAQHLVPSASSLVQADQVEATEDPIPDIVQATPFLSEPEESNVAEERYTVVLHDVPVKELLFTLARDSNINIDIHSDIEGNVTVNAVDETLSSILARLARQVDFIYEVKDGVLVVRPDTKYWHSYIVDYLSMERSSNGSMSLSMDSSSEVEISSTADVTTTNESEFWNPIIEGITNIIELDDALLKAESDKRSAEKGTKAVDEEVDNANSDNAEEGAAGAETSSTDPVIAHQATGTISVLATARQHRQIQVFFDNIMATAQRQVLIEATIVEVRLNDYHQRGIDWSRAGGATNIGFGDASSGAISTSAFANTISTASFAIGHSALTSSGTLSANLKFLDEFGDVSVLSSPKVMAINNQTAMMKVVDEVVYFSLEISPGTVDADTNLTTDPSVEATKETALEGIIIAVTPHINQNGVITLHVRPTISQLLGSEADPTTYEDSNGNAVTTGNTVPEFQVREMDSMLRVPSGQVVVLGGMMRDKVLTNVTKIPGLSRLPFIGGAFEKKQREVNKTELAIFLRPTIITPEKMNYEVQKSKLSFGVMDGRFGEDDGLKKMLKGLRRADKTLNKWKKSIGLSAADDQ